LSVNLLHLVEPPPDVEITRWHRIASGATANLGAGPPASGGTRPASCVVMLLDLVAKGFAEHSKSAISPA
jgi:hypothetical protein